MRVFITGATGLVGTGVREALLARGDEVVGLSRSARTPRHEGERWVKGDVGRDGDWQAEVSGCDAVIHLAGESIGGGRWNAAMKKRLVDSRIDSTQAVVRAIGAASERPRTLLNASACGYYGSRGEEELREDSAPGDDFLARLCREWEAAAGEAGGLGVRVAFLRFAIVLSGEGGALENMVLPFKLGVGGPIGPKERWFPWVHVNDAVGLVIHALDREEISGPLNLVAPGAVRMAEFAQTLGRVLRRPALIPVPLFALRLPLGEFADYVSPGQRVSCERVRESGFDFRFPQLEGALRECLDR